MCVRTPPSLLPVLIVFSEWHADDEDWKMRYKYIFVQTLCWLRDGRRQLTEGDPLYAVLGRLDKAGIT